MAKKLIFEILVRGRKYKEEPDYSPKEPDDLIYSDPRAKNAYEENEDNNLYNDSKYVLHKYDPILAPGYDQASNSVPHSYLGLKPADFNK